MERKDKLAVITRNGIRAIMVVAELGRFRWECDDDEFHSELRYAHILAEKQADKDDWVQPHVGIKIKLYADFVAKNVGGVVEYVKPQDPDVIY